MQERGEMTLKHSKWPKIDTYESDRTSKLSRAYQNNVQCALDNRNKYTSHNLFHHSIKWHVRSSSFYIFRYPLHDLLTIGSSGNRAATHYVRLYVREWAAEQNTACVRITECGARPMTMRAFNTKPNRAMHMCVCFMCSNNKLVQ